MHFCSKCQQITTSNTTRDRYDKNYDMITANCAKCGLFKYRYLVKKIRKEGNKNE